MTEQEWPYSPFAEVFDRILHEPHEVIVAPEETWQPPQEEINQAHSQTLEIARRLPKKPFTGETPMQRTSRVKIKDERVPLFFARFYLPANQETTFQLYPFSEDALVGVQLYSPITMLHGRHPNQLFFEFYEDQNKSLEQSPLVIKGTVYPYPSADSGQGLHIDPALGVGFSSLGPRPISPGNFSILKATLESVNRRFAAR